MARGGVWPETPRAEAKTADKREKNTGAKRVSPRRISCDNLVRSVSKRAFGGIPMLVGVPREIKDNEFRVGMTPAVVAELVHHGHSVLVERSAGLRAGRTDEDYPAASAAIVDAASEIFARADMVVKVKEPQEAERRMLRNGQTL